MQLLRAVTTRAFIATSIVLTTAPARAADVAPKTTLLGLVEDGNRFVNAAMAGTAPSGRTPSENVAASRPAAEPPPLVDFAPRASLVARDWRGSLRVAGRTMLLDDLRPSASQRMVLARVASDARLSPFVQIGAGEWRIDPVLFPNLPSRQAMAGQVGAGFELRTRSGVSVASEASYTFLYRPGPVAVEDGAPRIVALLFAIQTAW